MTGQPVERECALPDGARLFYRVWGASPPGSSARSPSPDRPPCALILVHRGHEHSGRFADVVGGLGLSDVAVFAWDARGHGRSPGQRGYAPSFATLVRDLDEFVRHVGRAHGLDPADLVVLGHSIGAVAVAAWVHDYAPRIRAMVLVTPALRAIVQATHLWPRSTAPAPAGRAPDRDGDARDDPGDCSNEGRTAARSRRGTRRT